MASTLTTFDFALKERYTDQKVEELIFSKRWLLDAIPKDEDMQGDTDVTPCIIGRPQGMAGSSLSVAQTAAAGLGSTKGGNVRGERFTQGVGDYFASVEIGDKVIKAARGNAGAFLENKRIEIDALYEQCADNLATYLYGNGGGALGRRGSLSTNTITLSTADDVRNFEVGMSISASSADGSSTSDALRSGSTYVTAVDRINGTVTVNSAAAITSFADNDYLFRTGDFFGDTGVVVLKGLGIWIYGSDSPPALGGVTRTTDAQRLAGCRLTTAEVASMSLEERILTLATRMTGRFGGPGAEYIAMNPEDWQTLAYSLQSRLVRSEDKTARSGYQAIELIAGGTVVKCMADKHCPKGTFFALKMSSWKLKSMLKLLHTVNGDGLEMLRKSTTNDYEYRLVSYPLLACNAPGWNGRGSVS